MPCLIIILIIKQEVLDRLAAVTAELKNVTSDRKREVAILTADLESERDARRGLQDKAATLREQLTVMV